MTRHLLLLAAAATLAGCGTITITSDPSTFSVREDTKALRPGRIALVNGYPAETKVIILQGRGTNWDANLQQLTDTAIKVMSRHLVKNGVAVDPQAAKTVTLRVRDVAAVIYPYSGIPITLRLEAQFGDSTKAAVSAENRSPGTAGRALDGALLFAVTRLLNDDRFVDYVNR